VIGRWLQMQAVRLRSDEARKLAPHEGECIESDAVVIRKLSAECTLEAMFAGKSADEWRALYRDAYKWGPDVGREAIEG
jgi:antitoxin MazE